MGNTMQNSGIDYYDEYYDECKAEEEKLESYYRKAKECFDEIAEKDNARKADGEQEECKNARENAEEAFGKKSESKWVTEDDMKGFFSGSHIRQETIKMIKDGRYRTLDADLELVPCANI